MITRTSCGRASTTPGPSWARTLLACAFLLGGAAGPRLQAAHDEEAPVVPVVVPVPVPAPAPPTVATVIAEIFATQAVATACATASATAAGLVQAGTYPDWRDAAVWEDVQVLAAHQAALDLAQATATAVCNGLEAAFLAQGGTEEGFTTLSELVWIEVPTRLMEVIFDGIPPLLGEGAGAGAGAGQGAGQGQPA